MKDEYQSVLGNFIFKNHGGMYYVYYLNLSIALFNPDDGCFKFKEGMNWLTRFQIRDLLETGMKISNNTL